ncbi:very short patch repair endonuclease [Roseibacillus persicicus]|uniref:very short patch repair endonuclease n=1 Tax=Roseibacillus persicicus TaxID=454148 RepID=UPI0028100D21|nr:very short patch repair endonuclease [Roseibacillus persicicus]MDQ8189124.1 very short patch repair endonuclease [Roseibacillus persicicus]
MADLWDAEKRSWVMSRIRSRDTKPEIVVRSILHRLGYRFTINGPLNKSLPGKPDIVLPKWKTVVLVHGCFWHAHEGCKDFRIPKTRSEWWAEKLAKNKARDAKVKRELREAGWQVITIWACEMKTVDKLAALVIRLGNEMASAEKKSSYRLPAETATRVAEEVKGYRVSKRKP